MIDEVAGYLATMTLVDRGHWAPLVVGFVVFRFLDIVKPPPIRYFDRKWKTGFGVMFDDLLAAFYTLIVLAVARSIFPD